ncbi:unknown similar to AMEV007 [Mythimna separata entomopoxvirus 'L']|uniref:BPTI/Kunitz inhibitor domain-containing protein n=1 Tax=Mythimna separata entomopoxvirus 'L' TaxID=1293572 RepID=A0A916KPY4_9POXV|nr:unknown similar to AMEV007 [Mythimna separata entomopoxvirus 'L']CCU56219.1 unknown similar to AMEV007 [Mythimna separata entomopoxvirus 'L']
MNFYTVLFAMCAFNLGLGYSYKIIPISYELYCNMEYDPGMCRSSIPKWYYDLKTNNCKKFIYGGCDGNYNNFNNYYDCIIKCKKHVI